MFSNKTYDKLNTFTKVLLPLTIALVLNLNKTLHMFDEKVFAEVMAYIIAFLNGLLGSSSLWYYKEGDTTSTDLPVEKKRVFPSFPSIHEKYFLIGDRDGSREGKGGYSPCITGEKELYDGCTLNNCVGLAWGLFAMAEGNPNCKVGFIASPYYPQGAGSFYNKGKQSKWDKYERGDTPRLGSIICYEKHVAYVNEILDNGDLLLYSSSWGSSIPQGMEEVLVKKSNGYAWRNQLAGNFQGFIYPKKICV